MVKHKILSAIGPCFSAFLILRTHYELFILPTSFIKLSELADHIGTNTPQRLKAEIFTNKKHAKKLNTFIPSKYLLRKY